MRLPAVVCDALGGEQILDAERHAGERLEVARAARRVGGVGGGERMSGVSTMKALSAARAGDRGVERLGDLARGEVAVAEAVAERGDGRGR